MDINFNRMPGRIYDFITSLVYAYSDCYVEDYKQLNLIPNKDVQEILEKIKKKVDINFNGAELFFNNENPCAEAFIKCEDIWNNTSFEEYIRYLESLDEVEIRRRVLKYLNDDKDIDPSVLDSRDNLFEVINDLKISKTLKWDAYELVQDPVVYMKEFLNFLKGYIKLFNDVEKAYKKAIDNFDKYIEKNFQEKGIEYIDELTKRNLGISNKDLFITTMFFNSYSFALSHREDRIYVFAGIDFEESIKKLQGEGEIENNLNIYKSISDSTRFEILRMISQREMYGQEIAEKFGITLATITYHMNFLLGTNIVKTRPEGRKIYYSLNRDTLRGSIKFLNNILNL